MAQFTIDGMRIYGREEGPRNAQLALMIHGWSSSWYAMSPLLPLMARRFRCLAVDLPGYGNSPRLEGRTTIPRYADLLSKLISELSDGPVVLVGHSMGGMISLTIAIRRPELVERMVLLAPTISGKLSAFIDMFVSPITMIERFPATNAALTALDPQTLQPTDDVPGLPEGLASLLVPGAGTAAARRTLLRALRGTDAVVGPAVTWLEVSASHRRVVRCLALGVDGLVDSDDHLAALLLGADPDARAALRARVLAPMADLRPSTAEKLTETLRVWLLHHGRREAIAEALFVHPQTVRYRVGQLREVYGDRLEDPAFVLDATLALA